MKIKGSDKENSDKTNKTKPKRMRFFTLAFWDLILCKIAEVLISVKLWILLLTFAFCYYGMVNGYLEGANVAAILCATIAPIVVMREGFKIAKIRDMAKIIVENTELDEDMKDAIDKIRDVSS